MPALPKCSVLGLLLVLLVSCSTTNTVQEKGYAVLKVNRTFLDANGHETVEIGDLKAEAEYQYELRHRPELQHGVRFRVKWDAPDEAAQVRVQVDVRGLNPANETLYDTVSIMIGRTDGWAQWTALDIPQSRLKRLGSIQAWKVTIFAGGKAMAVLPSGNWYGDIRATAPDSSKS